MRVIVKKNIVILIQIEKKNLHAVLLERCPIKAETNSLEYQLRS